MKKNILILGSSSFIGKNLKKFLNFKFNIIQHNSKKCNFLKINEVKKFSKKIKDNTYIIITLSLRPEIINNLIPQQVHTQVFEAILNSIASEHGARMTAMHKATDNADELKQGLTLTYNRQRQAAITNEILEIVAGAEALKNS